MSNTTLIKSANTRRGFAIGIVNSGPHFDVVRIRVATGYYVTLSRHADETTARTQANIDYRKDKG